MGSTMLSETNADIEENIPKRTGESENGPIWLIEGISRQLEDLACLKSHIFREICLFSIIECLAQDYYNYPRNRPQDVFIDYLLKFNDKHAFLKDVDPVTLYYRVEGYFTAEDKEKFETRLDDILRFDRRDINSVINHHLVEEVFSYIGKKITESQTHELQKQHRFVNLMYKLRCKLSHENQSPGGTGQHQTSYVGRLPYYDRTTLAFIDKADEAPAQRTYWQLVMPVDFLVDALNSCLKNHLEDCNKRGVRPFENNAARVDMFLSWYDPDSFPKSR